MALTNIRGPLVINGFSPAQNGVPATSNPDLGPSLAYGGVGVLDDRYPYQDTYASNRALGFAGGDIFTLDVTPNASAVNNIVASAVPTVGTAMTLATSTTSVVNKLAATVTVFPSGQVIPVGTLVLEQSPGTLTTGTNSAILMYDPTLACARAVKVAYAGNDASLTMTVSGYDVYGYAMTEKIAGASGATVNGKKAFKFISSVLPGGTAVGSNVSVGTTDIIGLPVAASAFQYLTINVNSAKITANTGFVAAVATSPATSTTGDVRGTYAMQTAANGTLNLTVTQMVTPAMIKGGDATTFGVTQV